MTLPPLNALRAFESAGRHQSFLLASKELHVSSASISRFVKMMEADLGKALFIRHSNGVNLTEFGEKYLLAIQPPLQNIASATDRFRQENAKSTLKIVSIPAVAETWLVSRLWSFQQQHKDIQINLVVDDQLVVNDKLISLHPHEATVVLNYSDGQQEGAESYAMPKDRLTLVCNQEVANTLKKPSDIYQYPLLVDRDWQGDWQAWFNEAGLLTDVLTNEKNHSENNDKHNYKNYIEFERYSMVLHATLAGSGVAIGHTSLLESYLNTGALVAPFDITATADKQFYALIAKGSQLNSVQAFIEWFLD